jgi:hypothetical protein
LEEEEEETEQYMTDEAPESALEEEEEEETEQYMTDEAECHPACEGFAKHSGWPTACKESRGGCDVCSQCKTTTTTTTTTKKMAVGRAKKSGGCVYYQACGRSDASVKAEYRSKGTAGWTKFGGKCSYSGGRWSSSCWSAGNYGYDIRLTVNGVSIMTDEKTARANGQASC